MISSVLLKCAHCSQKLGTLSIDDISLMSAEQVIQFMINQRITLLCPECSCSHEFNTVRLRSTAGDEADMERYS